MNFTDNRILSLLEEQDLARITPHLREVSLPRDLVIVEQYESARDVYFIASGISSLIVAFPGGRRAEAGIVGREGVVPIWQALGVTACRFDIVMQADGTGYRMEVDRFREIVSELPGVREVLTRFAYSLSFQTACTALSNAIHPLGTRLARWLLMCHDRSDGHNIEITHKFVAIMLGVRRSSVTMALHELEGQRLIRLDRGRIRILSRDGLENLAEDAYGSPEREYDRVVAVPAR